MSVSARYTEYTDLCAGTMYGSEILNLPVDVLERLNDLLDGIEVDMAGETWHPDNVWVNLMVELDDQEVVVDRTGLLTASEWESLGESASDWVSEHEDEVVEALEAKYTVLGREGTIWYVMM